MAKDHNRKIDKPGKTIYVAFDGDFIRHSEGGLGNIKAHLETLEHFSCVTALPKNQLLPGSNRCYMVHRQHITMTKVLCQQLQAHLLSHQFMC